jgi:hypothetical protein
VYASRLIDAIGSTGVGPSGPAPVVR